MRLHFGSNLIEIQQRRDRLLFTEVTYNWILRLYRFKDLKYALSVIS